MNLGLGFLVAAYAEQASTRLVAILATNHSTRRHKLPKNIEPAAAPPVDGDSAAPSLVETEPDASSFDPQSLPRNWRHVLAESRVKVQSPIEGLLWTFKLELVTFREKLVQLENQLKKTSNIVMVLGGWRARHQEWASLLGEFAKTLNNGKSDSAQDEIEVALKNLLQDHRFDVEQTAKSLKLISDANEKHTSSPSTNNTVPLRRQLSEQIQEFHSIRDRIDDFLATFLRENDRFDDIDEALQIEGPTEIYNRLGFEVIYKRWRGDNPNGEQPACCLLIDIDRFSQENEKYGNKTGDVIIASFGGLLKSLVREERGLDLLARFNGHSYLLFLGDTTLDNALIVAERTRQCIEAASFKVGTNAFDVTTSLGLAEIAPTESELPTYYTTLQDAVATAKSAGRNRTCVVRGDQSEIAETKPIQVTGRVIEIAEQE
jgi:diguanylate cyclase (GGDEF)-like protein